MAADAEADPPATWEHLVSRARQFCRHRNVRSADFDALREVTAERLFISSRTGGR
jgi:hypothetical protein